MADLRFINVFLDTQFFDSNQLDFFNKTFEVLRSNVAAGQIHVFSTEVTYREVQKHVRERAAKVHEKLESVRKDSLIRHVTQPPFDALQSAPSHEDIEGVMLRQLSDCWSSLRTTTLLVKDTNILALLDSYFKATPPFSSGKKKSEFPDAIAAQALQAWCKASGQKMHVISGDGDWRAVCEMVPELIHKTDLAEILSSFPNAEISKTIREWILASDEVKKAVEKAFREHLFSKAGRPGKELRTVDVKQLRVSDAYVIQLDNGLATVELLCKIAYRFMKVRTQLISHGEPEPYEGKSKAKAVAELVIRYDMRDPSANSIESVGISLRRPFAPGYSLT
jgi:hypothetical protein